MLGHILEFSLDQHGSRFLQQKLDTLSHAELARAWSEVASQAGLLMRDVFGNYIVQKMLELGPQETRDAVAEQIKGKVRAFKGGLKR